MPIFDQGYQHWKGRLSSHAWCWLAITRRGVRTQWDKKATKWVVYVALIPALALAAILILWSLFEQKSELIAPLLILVRGLPDELRAGPREFRVPIWTICFDKFLQVESFFSMVLVLVVGPDLISQDLRFNAMPLYFSRPLRRVDYFLGKLGVIAFYLIMVTVVPIFLAYGLGVGFSLDYHIVGQTLKLLGAATAYAMVVVVSAGTLMLALSSLSKNSRFVGGMWLVIWIIGNGAAGILTAIVHVEWGPLISYLANLHRLRETLLDTDTAWKPISKLFEMGASPAFQASNLFTQFPWHWSAATLAVLFGISLCILSLRVRSLDRLR